MELADKCLAVCSTAFWLELDEMVHNESRRWRHLNDKNEQQIGAATYVIERVFTGTKTIQEVVTEEIIFTGKKAANFDRQESRMV